MRLVLLSLLAVATVSLSSGKAHANACSAQAARIADAIAGCDDELWGEIYHFLNDGYCGN